MVKHNPVFTTNIFKQSITQYLHYTYIFTFQTDNPYDTTFKFNFRTTRVSPSQQIAKLIKLQNFRNSSKILSAPHAHLHYRFPFFSKLPSSLIKVVSLATQSAVALICEGRGERSWELHQLKSKLRNKNLGRWRR